MALQNVYSELKSWQPALGAFFGLIALLLGALWNYRLGRRRDDHIRKEEARSVAAALYSEIVIIRGQIAWVARQVSSKHIWAHNNGNEAHKIDQNFVSSCSFSEPVLFNALASKIGLLDATIVLGITEFHDNYREVQQSLTLLVENESRKYSYSPLVVLKPARDAVLGSVAVVSLLEALLSLPQSTLPSLGDTDTVIDMEEAFWAS